MTGADILQKAIGTRCVVVGDLMLDCYVYGSVSRVSPEAPVLVVRKSHERVLAGGAANVAGNLARFGASVSLIGLIGDDDDGQKLLRLVTSSGIDARDVAVDANRPTTTKTRILADSAHQVLRIDDEADRDADPMVEDSLIEKVRLAAGRADVVLISDYAKGCVTRRIVETVITSRKEGSCWVVVNGKPANCGRYAGSDLLTLNRKEAVDALAPSEAAADLADASGDEVMRSGIEAARALREKYAVEHAAVTLGEHGLASESVHVAPFKVEVFDASGAGDTSVAALALAVRQTGLSASSMRFAARAAACAVQHAGVSLPSDEDLKVIADTEL